MTRIPALLRLTSLMLALAAAAFAADVPQVQTIEPRNAESRARLSASRAFR